MGRLLRDLRVHHVATLLFVVWALAVWCVTLATWMFDETGMPLGMHPVGTILTLALPVTGGGVIGWWRLSPAPRPSDLSSGARGGAFAGMLLAVISLVGENLSWLLVYPLILRRPLGDTVQTYGLLWALAELLEFAVIAAVVGLVLGALGGLAGYVLAWAARTARSRSPNGGD